jgi:hypothetical protein
MEFLTLDNKARAVILHIHVKVSNLEEVEERNTSYLNSNLMVSDLDNVTLSIDLRTSWTNTTLLIQTVSKGSAPVLNYEGLWAIPGRKSCYLWSGELSYLTKTFEKSPDTLWKFSSDEAGGGMW